MKHVTWDMKKAEEEKNNRMKKVLTKISVAVFLVSAFIPFLGHAQQETPLTPTECFDYYKFGSVSVDINPALEQTVSGAQMRFYLTVTNQNDYPIVDGSIYVKIFQKQTDSKNAQMNGSFLVDQFFAKEGIALDAKEVKNFELLWNVPAWAPTGNYMAFSYFESAKKFNLLGLTFTDDITGSRAAFDVKGDFKKSVGLDRNNVKVNSNKYSFALPPLQFSKDEPLTVQIPILNPTKEKQETSVTYDLYFWDGLASGQKLGTKNENVTLNPGETKTLSYQLTDNKYPVYYLVVKSKWHDFSSILDIRTVRQDISRPRINFVGTTAFPIRKGVASTIFACIHDTTPTLFDAQDASSTPKAGAVKLELSLLDNEKNLVQKYVYNGEVGSNIIGFKADLAPVNGYDNFGIKASLYDNQNKLLDEANLKYDCGEINKDKCLSKDQLPAATTTPPASSGPIKPIYLYVVLGIIVIGIAVTIMIRTRKKLPMEPPTGPPPTIPTGGMAVLLFFFIGLGVVLGAMTAQAKSTSYFHQQRGYMTAKISAGGFSPGANLISDPFYIITYNAKVKDGDGKVLKDGDKVVGGTQLIFSYKPSDFSLNGSETAFWFSIGGIFDSPFGHWNSGGGYPYTPSSTCNDMDYFYERIYYRHYRPLSVNIPTVTFDTSEAEASGVLGGCVTSGSKRTCNVIGIGTINVSAKFEPTYGYHYANIKGSNACYYLGPMYGTVSDATPFKLDIPEMVINFQLVATSKSAGTGIFLDAPLITGPIKGKPGQPYDFKALSNSSGSKKIVYEFDWDGNGSVDSITAPLDPKKEGVGTKTWTSDGSYNFKVRANGDSGAIYSGWSPYSIFIGTYVTCTPSEDWTPCTVSCGGGTQDKVKIDAVCKVQTLETRPCNVQACGTRTIIKEVPP